MRSLLRDTGRQQLVVQRGQQLVWGKRFLLTKRRRLLTCYYKDRLPGVSVMAISGRPGEAAKVRIRGTNTISGDAEPLWVVDGVPLQQNVPNISTGQIKSGNLNEILLQE